MLAGCSCLVSCTALCSMTMTPTACGDCNTNVHYYSLRHFRLSSNFRAFKRPIHNFWINLLRLSKFRPTYSGYQSFDQLIPVIKVSTNLFWLSKFRTNLSRLSVIKVSDQLIPVIKVSTNYLAHFRRYMVWTPEFRVSLHFVFIVFMNNCCIESSITFDRNNIF